MSIPTHDRTVRTSSPGTRDSGNNRKKTINPEAGTTGTGTVWKPYEPLWKAYGNRMGTVPGPYGTPIWTECRGTVRGTVCPTVWRPYETVWGPYKTTKKDRMVDRMETVWWTVRSRGGVCVTLWKPYGGPYGGPYGQPPKRRTV